ncbi:methylmalonyl-CoA mutase family protein [Streptomyces sp. HD]|uniref:methylmalonyl-CoA mutase family protein n=1 Tax=Streptomyces sp. HD TaxID=3020892 RepID=UPI00232D9EEE|nr:methylmalonyl-CoA mutase family protein [Streptomyces sp. HD]MDC0768172.1 methylmalonyl-CoA mutase family protein [Streptomyces sp. HD]
MTVSGTATQANATCRQLVADGARIVPIGFDLPTRAGLDSDAPQARGLVGRCGVPVDSIDDMRVLFNGLPLDRVRPTLAADAAAAPLLVLCRLVAEEHGTPPRRLAGAVRNDAFRSFLTGGLGGLQLRPLLRLAMDVLAYGVAELPRWQCLSVCGHQLAGPGADPALEVAFAVACGMEYLHAAAAGPGLDASVVVPRLTLCLAKGATGPETRAKLRAVRRVWTRTANERFAANVDVPRLYVQEPRGGTATPPDRRRPRTAGLETEALALLERLERLGGALAVVERGLGGTQLGRRFENRPPPRPHLGSAVLRARQTEQLAKLRAWRVEAAVDEALVRLGKAAQSDDNVLHPMKEALAARATVGEVSAVLRTAWGPHPQATLH